MAKIRGFDGLKRNVEKLNSDIEKILPTALKAGALIVQNQAKKTAPYLTGTLRRSIHIEERRKRQVVIGTNVEYAKYQEFGTRKMAARPYLRPALDDNRQKIIEKVQAVIKTLLRK